MASASPSPCPRISPKGGSPPSVVAAVPVTDLGEFLDSLKGLGLAVDDQPGVPGFSHKVTAPNGNPTLFVLKSKGYALFSLVPDGADRLKVLDPTSWKPKGRRETTISVKVRLSELPDALKDQFLNQLQANMDQKRDREPGEADAQYQGRLAGQQVGVAAMKSLVRDGDEIELDLDLDRKTSALALELGVGAQPNTAMAKTLRALHGRRSRFQALSKDAAMSAWATTPVVKEFRDMIARTLERTMKDNLEKAKTGDEKKFETRLGELLKSVLAAPDVDLGLAIQGPSAAKKDNSHLVMLGGITVKNAREFERLLRDAVALGKLGENVKMTFDVAKAADGTPIHQMSGPIDEKDAGLAKRFGKASLFVAFRDDAILTSFGETGLEPLRQAIARFSDQKADGPADPIAVEMHVANVGDFADKEKDTEAFRKAVSEVFPGAGPKHDRLALELKGQGDGIRLRLAIDVPALKLMGMIGMRKPH